MKSLAMKFIAIILATLCLLATIGSGLAIALVSTWESDGYDAEQALKQEFRSMAWEYAMAEARYWAAASRSTAPQEAVEALADRYIPAISYDPLLSGLSLHAFTLCVNGEVVESGGSGSPANAKCWSFHFTDITPTYTQVHSQALGTALPGCRLLRTENYNGEAYNVFACQDLTFQVDVVLYQTASYTLWDTLEWIWQIRDGLIVILLGSLLLGAACIVYLCWAAGRKPKCVEIRPGGLNRLPLDLYAAMDGILGYFCLMLLAEGVSALIGSGMPRFAMVAAVAAAFAMCLMLVLYLFAVAAQVKVKDHFWWRRSLVGFVLILVYRAARWFLRAMAALFRLLPVVWQWLLTAFCMAGAVLVCFLGTVSSCYHISRYWSIALFFAILGCIGIVLYGAWCFGTIVKGAKQMAAGDLDHKVNTRYLFGAFRSCGAHLNTLSSAAMVAARQQMKSERMKTELIANVSHDIKTPLTSIINYIDLLLKPHSDEEQAQYLEVLARQSQRLKKLTEDLVEMSKASSGNITAELTDMDACEAVRQALGEFAGKLEAVPLNLVFHQPEEPIMMCADGRLTWRVLSNLLNNAVKYAQPGTRLYVDVAKIDNRVLISLKNMSREQLNVTAEELMERFVRGDASRHTEGSGLGLNIAKGLMEAQNGTLHLHIDGDLFKVTLFFPAA